MNHNLNNIQILRKLTIIFISIYRLTQADLPNWVYSGVALWYKDRIHTFTEVTTVYMEKLEDKEILSYVETGEPM